MINFVYLENGIQYKTAAEVKSPNSRLFLQDLASRMKKELEKYECPTHKKNSSLTLEVGIAERSPLSGLWGAKIVDFCCTDFSSLMEEPVKEAQIPKANS